MHANADEIIAFPDPNPEAAVRRAIDKPAGFFARHLPDTCAGQVVLASLDPATIPPEVQGVWWYDAVAGNYKFWVPGAPGGGLTTLTGQFYEYQGLVSGACEWIIPLP